MFGIIFSVIGFLIIFIIFAPVKLILKFIKTTIKVKYKRQLQSYRAEGAAMQIRHQELFKMGYETEVKNERRRFKFKIMVTRMKVQILLALLTFIKWVLVFLQWFFGLFTAIIGFLVTGAVIASVIAMLIGYVSLEQATMSSGEFAEEEESGGSSNTSGGTTNNSLAALAVEIFRDMAKYEMGDANSGKVAGSLGDGAGKNYGKYSFTQKYEIAPADGGGFVPWLKKHYPDLGKELTAAPASAEFDAQWQALGAKKDKEFTEAQALYVLLKLEGVVKMVKDSTGVDLNNGQYTTGVWSILASMYNQRPAWISPEIWVPYLSKNPKASSEDIIRNTAGYLKVNYGGNYAQSIRNRYAEQEKNALNMKDKIKVDFSKWKEA